MTESPRRYSQTVSVLREKGGNCTAFSDFALEITFVGSRESLRLTQIQGEAVRLTS